MHKMSIPQQVAMASFYELTEDEVEFLLEALEYWRENGPPRVDEEIRDYLELKEYLKTRQRHG